MIFFWGIRGDGYAGFLMSGGATQSTFIEHYRLTHKNSSPLRNDLGY